VPQVVQPQRLRQQIGSAVRVQLGAGLVRSRDGGLEADRDELRGAHRATTRGREHQVGRQRPTTIAAMPQLRAGSFYRELAQRLAPVLPPLVEVSAHPRVPGLRLVGQRGSGLLFPTLVIPGPFRFRVRVSAKTVLGGVQAFVLHQLHRPWPEAEGIGPDDLPKPRAAVTQDFLRLWYEGDGQPVLELAPIPLDRLRR
jgi:hypothetical protein